MKTSATAASPSTRETRFESYSGLHSARGTPADARSIDALSTLVQGATAQGRRITLRGGGMSFDAHALGTGLVLSIDAISHMTLDTTAHVITVGAGARWRDVLSFTANHGLVPPVLVTTGDATVGGTLAAHCHSRFSPTLGKEGRHVESLLLITAEGEVRRCSRTEHPELFYTAIGGFGLVGVIAEVTFRLLDVGAPPQVETDVIRYDDISELARLVRPDLDPPDVHGGTHRSAFGLLALRGDRLRLVVSKARLVAGKRLSPMIPHQPSGPLAAPIQSLIQRFPSLGQAFWNFAYDVYIRAHPPYVDPIHEYMFMMDSHSRARGTALRRGRSFRSLQASHVIPGDDTDPRGPTRLMDFVDAAMAHIRSVGHRLALLDVLWLPKDEPFAFSSTRASGGYVVTFSFGDLDDNSLRTLEPALISLTDVCIDHGGLANLVKNVYATPAQVQQMYGAAADEVFAVKRTFDPTNTFGNALIDRLFPTLTPTPLP